MAGLVIQYATRSSKWPSMDLASQSLPESSRFSWYDVQRFPTDDIARRQMQRVEDARPLYPSRKTADGIMTMTY